MVSFLLGKIFCGNLTGYVNFNKLKLLHLDFHEEEIELNVKMAFQSQKFG